MPSSTLNDLVDAYTQVGTRNQAILEAFVLIVKRFQQQGIAFIVLKGADVISRLYGVRGARPISDVDLLVHESDLPAIDRLLRDFGFTQQIDGNPSYASSERDLSLDLITTIWYLDRQRLADVWSRAMTRPFGATTICCLDTADLLIYLTAYTVIHRGHLSVSFVHDMKLLIEKEPPDWPAVIARIQQARLRAPLHHGLNHVRKIFPSIAIPDTVRELLAPLNRNEHMLAWFFRKLVTTEPLPEIGHLLLFMTQPGLTKISWLAQRLYPSSVFLSYRYGSTERTRPWRIILLRWYHLAKAGLTLSGPVLRRLITPSRLSS
ncbi:MAG: nucleotidyltransferase family protein [Nitrospira sp.]|nr:nucleotidyltransferase family protein [Nitrospira sp.]